MEKEMCPICLGAGTEMKSNAKNNGLVYEECPTCDGTGEVEGSIFEHYDDDELI